jgi:fluoride exporter
VIIGEVALAGALGAVLRYLVDHLVQRRADSEFPFGVMAVNLSGSFILGVLVGAGLHHGVSTTVVTVAGTGLIGSYTTFSTFTFDSVRLAEDGYRSMSVLNVTVGIVVGIALAATGLALGSLL